MRIPVTFDMTYLLSLLPIKNMLRLAEELEGGESHIPLATSGGNLVYK